MKNKYSGFTLVELLVTIALMGIMAAFAIPSMNSFVANARLNNRVEQLANLFRFAKAEAVRLNAPVVVCGVTIRSDGRSNGQCGAVNSTGWFAYADINRNGRYDNGTDTDLRTISLNGTTQQQNQNQNKVSVATTLYNISGQTQTDGTSQFVFMPNATFGRKTQANSLAGVILSDRYVRFTVTDLEKTNRIRHLVVAPSGNVNVCIGGNTKKSSGTSSTNQLAAVGCDFS